MTLAGNFDELKSEVSSFQRTLLAVLVALGVALLGGLAFQVRFTLKPLADMQHQLNDIRSGRLRAEFLGDNFPRELQPVADELNLLVEANLEIVERARMQVGNLAHSLKTPISVLNNEARATPSRAAGRQGEGTDRGDARPGEPLPGPRPPRRAAPRPSVRPPRSSPFWKHWAALWSESTATGAFEIAIDMPAPCAFAANGRTSKRCSATSWTMPANGPPSASWCTPKAVPGGNDEARNWLTITVDDDGPGIPAEKRATALEDVANDFDESKPRLGPRHVDHPGNGRDVFGYDYIGQGRSGRAAHAILRLPRVT